jgi:hypothetical protein
MEGWMPENKTDQEAADRDVPVITTPKDFEDLVREQGIERALIVVKKLRGRGSGKGETQRTGIDPAIMSNVLAKCVRRFLGQIGLPLSVVEDHTQFYVGRLRDLDLLEPPDIDDLYWEAGDPTPEVADSLLHFADISETLEVTAELLQREVADDLSERRAALAQMSKTQDSIQNKIDKADAWLARRAG